MTKTKENLSIIWGAMLMPEILMVVLYFLLSGIFNPDFGDFGYYFMMNVCHISKMQYSMMGVISQVTGIIGTMFYEKHLKNIEVRHMIYYSTWISAISSLCSYSFAMRWNQKLGIPDGVFIVLTDTVFGIIQQSMNLLPSLALFAKITPMKIEGTVYAVLTGTTNLSSTLLSPMVGVWINERFVHVTANDLSNYKTLCLISFATTFLGFLLVPLIPLYETIDAYQAEREKKEKEVVFDGENALQQDDALAVIDLKKKQRKLSSPKESTAESESLFEDKQPLLQGK